MKEPETLADLGRSLREALASIEEQECASKGCMATTFNIVISNYCLGHHKKKYGRLPLGVDGLDRV